MRLRYYYDEKRQMTQEVTLERGLAILANTEAEWQDIPGAIVVREGNTLSVRDSMEHLLVWRLVP